MASSLTHDVVATIGEYVDRNTGQKKKRYLTVGKCFTDPEGRQSIKLDAIPGPGWSGWLSLYPVEKQAPRQPPDPRPEPRNMNVPANRGEPPPDDSDEEIPF